MGRGFNFVPFVALSVICFGARPLSDSVTERTLSEDIHFVDGKSPTEHVTRKKVGLELHLCYQ